MRICLIAARIPPVRCGVGDYSAQLAAELVRQGHHVTILTGADQAGVLPGARALVRNTVTRWTLAGVPHLCRELRALDPELIVLQWVPFLYSRTGTALGLPVALAACARHRPVRVMVHEAWVGFERPWFVAIGLVQRLALGLLVTAAERTGVSITAWTAMLQRAFPWKRRAIAWIPVGSGIDVDDTAGPDWMRDHLRMPPGARVIGAFGIAGSGKSMPLLAAAWARIREATPTAHLVLIGASPAEVRQLLPDLADDPRCHATGFLASEDVSRCLRGTDLLVCPFTDGMSTRRSSVIAALAHGVPVVSTRGRLTDPVFTQPGCPVVTTAVDAEEFATAAAGLAGNPDRLTALRPASLRFHQDYFSWPAIAARLIGPMTEDAGLHAPTTR